MGWNKIKTALLLGLILLISLASASAVLEFGEANTTIDVDYGDFNDEDQETLRRTLEFDVRNTNEAATIARFTFEGLPSGYNATSLTEINLSAGETRRITTSIDVPHKQDAGRTSIGTLILKDGSNTEQDRLTLAQNTNSMIDIQSIDADYIDKDGDTQSDDFDGDDPTIKLADSVRPGSDLRIAIEYKNIFDSDYDEDKSALEDLTMSIDFENDLFEDDVDDEYDLDELDANTKEEFVLDARIADDADAGDYTIEFTIKATDGEGFEHEETFELSIDVERDRDDVRLTKASIEPVTITSCDRDFTINAELRNFGTNDQKYSALAIVNSEFGINENVADIDLEEFDGDDTFSQNFPIVLKKAPSDGTHVIVFKAFIDRDELADEKRVNLVVTKCVDKEDEPVPPSPSGSATPPRSSQNGSTTTPPPTGTGGSTPPATPNTSTSQPGPASGVVQTIEEPYTNDDFLIAGLIIAIVVVIALIIIFFIMLLR